MHFFTKWWVEGKVQTQVSLLVFSINISPRPKKPEKLMLQKVVSRLVWNIYIHLFILYSKTWWFANVQYLQVWPTISFCTVASHGKWFWLVDLLQPAKGTLSLHNRKLGPIHTQRKWENQRTRERHQRKHFKHQRKFLLLFSLLLYVNGQLDVV